MQRGNRKNDSVSGQRLPHASAKRTLKFADVENDKIKTGAEFMDTTADIFCWKV